MKYGACVLVAILESKQFSDVKTVLRYSDTCLDVVVKTIEDGDDAIALANFTLLVVCRDLGLKDPVLRHKTRTNVLAFRIEEKSERRLECA